MATAGRLDIEIQARMKEGKVSVDALKKSFDALGYSVDSVQQKVSKVVVGKGANKHLEDQVRYTATYNDGLKKVTQTWNEQGQVIKSTATQTKKAFDTGRLLWYFNILRGVWNRFKNIETSAMDFNETIEKFNVSMGTSAEKAQLFQDKMANAIGTSRAEMMNYQANFKNIMAGLGTMSTETAEKISESLTKMTLDYSSLFNTSQSGAANKIQAALVGTIMPIRRESGYDVSKNAVSQKVSELGVEKTYTQLTETEKRLVRIMLLMDQMKNTGAFNDLARTIESPANQIKVLKNQLQELGIWLGNVFMGTIGAIMPYINGFIMALKEIIKLFAIFVGYTPIGNEIAQPLEEAAESVDDINTGFGGASKKAKELKKQLQGFDVLNVIQTPPESSGGGGGGSPTGVDPAILGALKEYDSLMDKVKMKATEIRDKILEWLGFFSEDGGLTWQLKEGETNLRKILDIVKAIGAAFLGYKLSKTFLNALNILQGGQWTTGQIKMKAAGVALMVGGLTLIYNGISHTIEDGELTPWNLLQILAGGGLTFVGAMMTFGKGVSLSTLISLGLVISGLTLMYSGVKHAMDNGFTQEDLWKIIGGGALSIAGGTITFMKTLSLGLGVSIAISAVIAALGTAFAAITNEIEKGKKKVHEQWDSIFSGLGGWSEALNTAGSYLDGFNSKLFATNEEQANLATNMSETQGAITAICKTAHDERRDLTDEEIKKLDEYFQKLAELTQRELELETLTMEAILQQSSSAQQQAAKDFDMSSEEYKNTAAKWVNTANQQKDQLIKIAERQATEKIALLNQQYDTEEKRQSEDYQTKYNTYIKERDEAIKSANEQVNKVNDIWRKGYGERVEQNTGFAEKYKNYLEGIKKNEQAYEYDYDHITAKLAQTTDEWIRKEGAALGRYGQANQDTFNDTIGTMSDAEKEATGVWLEWLMDTEAKGGEVSEKDKEIAENMIGAFENMPEEMKTQATQSLQGMLDGMKNREPELYKKATSMANSILSRLQKSFDIHSPSRKTRKMFEQVVKGMELGLDDEEGNLLKQADTLADKTLEALTIAEMIDTNNASNKGFAFGENLAEGINEGIGKKLKSTLAPFSATADISVGGLPDVGKMFGGEVAFAGSVGNASTGFGSDFLTQAVSQGVASAMSRMPANQGGSYNLYIDGEQITDVVQKRINRNANIFGR